MIFKIKERITELNQKKKNVKGDNKLYVLTRCNTLVNRDLLDKREYYLKKVKTEYQEIYGKKGVNYFNSIQENIPKPKKGGKVKFSGEIEYSN